MNYKYVGKVDVSDIKSKLDSIEPSMWKKDDVRQKSFKEHIHTETLMLMWDYQSLATTTPSKKHDLFYKFNIEELYSKLEPLYKEAFGDGYFVRCILVKLIPFGEIYPHSDEGVGLHLCHRTHIAIQTNPLVNFYVNDEQKHLGEGEIWEIDNTQMHAVVNDSDYDRIHFIIDWMNK